jgi:hypothetical protein
MILVHGMKQRTPEWFAARLGKPSASEISCLLVKGKADHGFGTAAVSYCDQLIGERITGEAADLPFDTMAMKRGRELEAVALELYAQDQPVTEVGGIENFGAWYSPDGLVGENGLVEVKSHKPSILVGMLLDPAFPAQHIDQCEMGLLLSGREWIDLVGYFTGMPLLHRRLYRNEDRLLALAQRIQAFNDLIETRMEKVMSV